MALEATWANDAPRQEAVAPSLVYSLAQLEEQLKKAYRMVTEGKFRWVGTAAGGCGGGAGAVETATVGTAGG